MIDNITKTNDCSSISITDSILTNFADYDSVILYHSTNDGTEKSYTVTVDDITSGTITLDPVFFEQSSDVLCDGIYCFKLKASTGDELTYKYGRILVDCSLICTLAEKLWNTPETFLYSKYEAIKLYSGCHECDCTTSYKLYLDLLCDLGISNTPCGC